MYVWIYYSSISCWIVTDGESLIVRLKRGEGLHLVLNDHSVRVYRLVCFHWNFTAHKTGAVYVLMKR